MADGKPRHLLPWLTACTYGQMDAVLTWEGALHTFGGGATGWSFFCTDCFDDPAKILALSTATALAAPFEDHFMDGMPLISGTLTVASGDLRAWSGVRLGSSTWLVLTPGKAGLTRPSDLTVSLALPTSDSPEASPTDGGSVAYSACDLTTGQEYKVAPDSSAAGSSLTIQAALVRTTVVHVAAITTSCVERKLPAGAQSALFLFLSFPSHCKPSFAVLAINRQTF